MSNYTVTPDANDGFTFNFQNLSKNYTKLEWRFGDDSVSVADNPKHIYLTTGDPGANPKWNYQVDLKATSSTGNISHKYTNIPIIPDAICQIAAAKTGVTTSNSAEVRFSLTVKATPVKATWTFVDAASFTSAAKTTVIEGLVADNFAVKKSFFVNTFNSVTLKVVTDKGSTVTVTRNVTTDGLVENVTGNRLSWTPSQDNISNANENASKLVDGNVDTKFLVGGSFGTFTYPLRCVFIFLTPQKIKLYAIGSANDAKARDPKSWTLEGSSDGGSTWTQMDAITMAKNFRDTNTDLGATSDSQGFKKLFYFPIADPKEYSMVRLNITANWGDGLLQLSEFQLFR
ncbi:MAG: hypothetical protein V4619_05840 [Bacteroidota bacterium]